MKVAIYSPYLDTAGGGEKYMLSIAEALSKDHQVDVLIDKKLFLMGIDGIINKNKTMHGLNLSNVNFIFAPIGIGSNFFRRSFFLNKYDWLFINTDGSIFLSTAKNNVIHFQVPFQNTTCFGLWGKIKLSSWRIAIYNSRFTKEIVEKTWPISGMVIYPPASIELFKPLTKRKQIISVGRFMGVKRDKKHELMIDTFIKLIDENNIKDWSLHLIGGASEGDQEYIDLLTKKTQGRKIYLYPNLPLKDLIQLYGESSIYWHVKGYQESDPKDFEHFGISTVEAMSSGCVPVVINKGGQPEVLGSGKCGFLWNDISELLQYTLTLIKEPKMLNEMSQKAILQSQSFSKERFVLNINNLVNKR